MDGSPPNLHTMDSRSACIQGVLKVKVKGHVIRALFWILGMSYSVIDGLIYVYICRSRHGTGPSNRLGISAELCALILFIQTLALYKSFTYLLTWINS